MSRFRDHFSGSAAEYARFRPRYPAALFSYLAGLASRRSVAWDCATGSGQAAVALAEHFPRVIATDASAAQIAHAELHPGVRYHVATAEQSGLASASVDLISVAQALHWFDLPGFHAEATRVLRPGGVLAVWCYAALELPGRALQRHIERFHTETVGPYWPPERRWVEEGYRSLAFPWPELSPPAFAMQTRMSLDALIGYLGTWSATQRYRLATGMVPLSALREELGQHWGEPRTHRTVQWPLALRVGRKPA
jgi:SAM-dependent methyltransferase